MRCGTALPDRLPLLQAAFAVGKTRVGGPPRRRRMVETCSKLSGIARMVLTTSENHLRPCRIPGQQIARSHLSAPRFTNFDANFPDRGCDFGNEANGAGRASLVCGVYVRRDPPDVYTTRRPCEGRELES